MKALFLLLTASLVSLADTSVDISGEQLYLATYPIPSLIAEVGEPSPFPQRLIRKILTKASIEAGINKIEMKTFPLFRALNRFKTGKAFAIYPAFPQKIPKSFLKSDCVASKRVFFFTRAQDKAKNYLETSAPRVVVTRGYYHSPELLNKFRDNLIEVKSMAAAIRMLKSGRSDILLGDIGSTVQELLKNNDSSIVFDLNSPVESHCAYLFTQNNEAGRAFMKAFNKVASEMNLKDLLTKHFSKNAEKLLKIK